MTQDNETTRMMEVYSRAGREGSNVVWGHPPIR